MAVKTFTVTQSHIGRAVTLLKRGETRCENCPVAVCLHENGYPRTVVQPEKVFFSGMKNPVLFPDNVTDWIYQFDNANTEELDKIRPITFDLDIPETQVVS